MMDEVIRLLDRGLSVFPVSIETKKPLISWDRLQEELPTYEEVQQWFSGEGRAVGVATGPVSNLFLLDFDFAKHPEAKEFYEAHMFPFTWKERTASGGVHLYFKWDEALNTKQTNTQSKLWGGVDTKGYGGYAKVCPSPGYEWEVAPHMSALASVPQWLLDLLPDRDRGRLIGEYQVKAANWMLADLAAINPGDGARGCTPTFTRVIGRLKAKGLSDAEVKCLLLPWAKQHEYEMRLDKLVNDQYQRYPQRTEVAVEDANHSLLSFVQNPDEKAYIIPGLLADNTINILAGLGESRKSWLLLDMAVAIASGTPWLNKFPTQRMKTLIIDQERPKLEMQRRVSALIAGRGLVPEQLEGFLIPKAGTTFRLNLDASFDAFTKLIETTHPQVVLIDSLKAIQLGDINSHHDMQTLFEKVKALRQKYGLTFVFLHHENKRAYERIREKRQVTAENIEGAGVINQVPEGIFVVANHDGDSSFVHHVKNSYGLKTAPFNVKVRDLTPDKQKIVVEAF